MAKRVGIVLSGCGAQDGSEVREAVVAMLVAERMGAQVILAAPDVAQPAIVNHLTGEPGPATAPRRVLVEAARIARGQQIRPLARLSVDDVDALIFPGGQGITTTLSNYASKAQLCDVDPDVVRLLKGDIASHRPMGFVGLAPLLAARVLGPIAGVRVTLGPRGTTPGKHAAIMGADVRPCEADDLVIDQKARVASTPGHVYEDASLAAIALGIDKLVHAVLGMAVDRSPAPPDPSRVPTRPDQRGKGAGQPAAARATYSDNRSAKMASRAPRTRSR